MATKNVDAAFGRGGGGGGGGGGGQGRGGPTTLPSPNKGIPTVTAEKPSAYKLVTDFLKDMGLESLGTWVWHRYQQLGGGDLAVQQINQEIVDQPAFKARFPAYDKLAHEGRAMSVAEMLSYERTAIGLMREAGLPSGFYDTPEDVARFMANDISVNELQQRITQASSVAQAPSETKSQLQNLYGISQGDLTAYFLDPQKALPVLQQRYQAGQLAGAAQRTGFGQIDRTEAERLQSLGVTQEAAQQGFGQLASQRNLFLGQVGESRVTSDQQMAAVFEQDAFARKRIQRRQEKAQNAFSGSSGFGAGNQGVTGLGGRQ
jgi:hypothetical protein